MPLHVAAGLLRQAGGNLANEFVSAYGGSDPQDRVHPRERFELAERAVELCAVTLEGGEVGTTTAGWEQLGRRMALEGVPVATAVGWLRLLEKIVTDRLMACPELLLAQARVGIRLLRELFDRLCSLHLEAHATAADDLAGWYSRMGTDLVTMLASGAPVEPHTIHAQARVLGIDPHQPFRAIAVQHEPAPSPQAWSRVRRRVLEALRRHDPRRDSLINDQHGLLLALVPTDRPGPGIVDIMSRLLEDDELGSSLFIAAGEPGDELAGAGRSCRQAMSALEIAIYRGQRGRVTQCTEVILEVLLAHNHWVSNRIVHSRLDCLLAKPHLLDTLRAYITSEMSLQRTAEKLIVHPNTVAYRLRQITALTGSDMRRVTHMVDFAVALTAYDVQQMRRDREKGSPALRARIQV
jgi:sugar diacid utilization regulator